jgi:hypothetical protein
MVSRSRKRKQIVCVDEPLDDKLKFQQPTVLDLLADERKARILILLLGKINFPPSIARFSMLTLESSAPDARGSVTEVGNKGIITSLHETKHMQKRKTKTEAPDHDRQKTFVRCSIRLISIKTAT